jgi:hypothetical protein
MAKIVVVEDEAELAAAIWRVSEDGALTCPANRFWWFRLVSSPLPEALKALTGLRRPQLGGGFLSRGSWGGWCRSGRSDP